jgi:hypothetical protein
MSTPSTVAASRLRLAFLALVVLVVGLLHPGVGEAEPRRGTAQAVDEHEQRIAALEEQVALLQAVATELGGAGHARDARIAAVEERTAFLEAAQDRFPVEAIGGPGFRDGGLTVDDVRTADGERLPGRYRVWLTGREQQPTHCFVVETHGGDADAIRLTSFSEGDAVLGTDRYGWTVQTLTWDQEVRRRSTSVWLSGGRIDGQLVSVAGEIEYLDSEVFRRGDSSSGFLLVVRSTPDTGRCVELERG